MKGAKVSFPLVIGSVAQALKKAINVPGQDWALSHKWCCYIRGLRENSMPTDPMEEQDLSFLIKKVEFRSTKAFQNHLSRLKHLHLRFTTRGMECFPSPSPSTSRIRVKDLWSIRTSSRSKLSSPRSLSNGLLRSG